MELEKNQTILDRLSEDMMNERKQLLEGSLSLSKARASISQARAIINVQKANIDVKHQALQYRRIKERENRT
jgi:hypothetical protein